MRCCVLLFWAVTQRCNFKLHQQQTACRCVAVTVCVCLPSPVCVSAFTNLVCSVVLPVKLTVLG